jgi:F-type H+-transporting ATPase subunit b
MFAKAEFWVAVSFVVFLGILWKAGAFAAIINGLDGRSARIKAELDEAAALRAEAEKVLADYKRRRAEAEKEAAEIVQAAKAEADRMASDAAAKLEDFVKRRTAMAEQRIAQAEAQAAADVRAAAADAAVKASEAILRETLKGAAGSAMLDKSLAEVKAKLN